MHKPTPAQIKETRIKAGLSQTKAADMVHVSLTAWQKWETPETASTHRPINMAAWELFLIKTERIMNIKDAKCYFQLERYGFIEFDLDSKDIIFASPDREGCDGYLSPDEAKRFFMSMALQYELDGIGHWEESGK